MTVLDELRKLEAKKQELSAKAKEEALAQANDAIAILNSLGYPYKLTGGPKPQKGQRRSGIRQEVLDVIANHQDGITRADLLTALNAKGDTKAEQAVSNAISALKKTDRITADNGVYTIAE